MTDSAGIPRYIVNDLLLGSVRKDVIKRFTPNLGVVSEVWVEFARSCGNPVPVLLSPCEGVPAADIGFVLHDCIGAYRARPEAGSPTPPTPPNISLLENFVRATLRLDELVRVVLPITQWWSERNLSALNGSRTLQRMLQAEIKATLVEGDNQTKGAPKKRNAKQRKVMDAAPLAALIGLLSAAARDPHLLDDWDKKKETYPEWLKGKADLIAQTAVEETLALDILPCLRDPNLSAAAKERAERDDPDAKPPWALVRRVFLDRNAELADADAERVIEGVPEGVRTIKADAADRLFGISCENLTWAIIDSGIAANHPAFRDHGASSKRSRDSSKPSRVRAILDFTLIEQIRSFDLISGDRDSSERKQAIEKVISNLKELPDRPAEPNFEEMARRHLDLIAIQLEARLQPDWNLIEPLIRRIPDDKKDPDLPSGHGTHVAGILAADWREARDPEKTILRGVCKDINLYDLRVIPKKSRESTEFAILAALEYVQFANRKILGMQQVIHGVNISLSIPHDVHNYACGATPICVACDNLVGSGVVVVAAGGNRGWNEQEIGFGNFVFCSITDPGNAEEVITVGATHRIKPHTYGVSFFSSRGPTGDGRAKPDLVAPGEKIRGPVLEDADDDLDGTSMAAPFVSGAAAMLMARHSELVGNPRRIKHILCASATDLGREKYFQGHGLVDVLRALQSV
jgi:subtilisin family serine protease